MILLSKIIKPVNDNDTAQRVKQIGVRNLFVAARTADSRDNSDYESSAEASDAANVVEGELERAKSEAEDIIRQAEQQAAAIREAIGQERIQATEEIERLKQQAMAEGFEEGYQAGQSEGLESYRHSIKEAYAIVESAKDDYHRTIEEAQPTIIKLAAALCEKIVAKRLEEDESLWQSLILQVMEEVREFEEVSIYVHPKWYEQTLRQKNELASILSGEGLIHVYPDLNLTDNGCVLETKFGRIDASMDSQLQQLKQKLLEKLKEADDGR